MIDDFDVCYSPQALEDLKDIYAYIAYTLQSPDIAQNQVNRIRKQIRSLDSLPERFPIVEWEPWNKMRMHKVPVDNYIVFYLVDSDSFIVTIIRIFYQKRDISTMINT